MIQSFEPDEDRFWDYRTEQLYEGPVWPRPGIARSISQYPA